MNKQKILSGIYIILLIILIINMVSTSEIWDSLRLDIYREAKIHPERKYYLYSILDLFNYSNLNFLYIIVRPDPRNFLILFLFKMLLITEN